MRLESLIGGPGNRGCQAFLHEQSCLIPVLASEVTSRLSAAQSLAPQKPDHESRCCPKRSHVDTHLDTCRNAGSSGSLPPWARRGTLSLGIYKLRVLYAWPWFITMAFPSPSLKVRHAGPSCGHSQVSSGTCSIWASSGTLSSFQAEHLLLR